MERKHKIHASEQSARRLQKAIDRAEGLPRSDYPADGGNVRFVGRVSSKLRNGSCADPSTPGPDCILVTRTHAEPLKHPSRNEWAYPVTETVRGYEGRDLDPGDGGAPVRIDTSDATELDETWRPDSDTPARSPR